MIVYSNSEKTIAVVLSSAANELGLNAGSMNLHELNELARRGESEQVEFKTTTGQRSEAMRTVCGMLNGLGGFVFFGVTPEGKLVGQTVATTTLESIHNELRQIEPPVFPEVEMISLPTGQSGGRQYLLARIEEANERDGAIVLPGSSWLRRSKSRHGGKQQQCEGDTSYIPTVRHRADFHNRIHVGASAERHAEPYVL